MDGQRLQGAKEAGEKTTDAGSSLHVGTAKVHGSEEIVLVFAAAASSLMYVVVSETVHVRMRGAILKTMYLYKIASPKKMN